MATIRPAGTNALKVPHIMCISPEQRKNGKVVQYALVEKLDEKNPGGTRIRIETVKLQVGSEVARKPIDMTHHRQSKRCRSDEVNSKVKESPTVRILDCDDCRNVDDLRVSS
ncbi:uncharacterized protein FOMMEDRAFT_157488 [Fomitiporia mediterranea MF3/22]|uniref:uncharacterized protein n=1 Tax=Fomitiporia mediterranea (strain MF3/22) TaxID=694068 RepID=UPI000440980F|nr:uncharacterized protein FOMMEDRAFT_157488 [Fomitiporia mediterranea MF3/22]EJD02271.1 hypothetical protein FOMMEDRAFT_157488 [Fomitiporia mediterranea MF3/22]